MSLPQQILDFWFCRADEPGYGIDRPEWFRKDPGFDAAIRERFLPAWQRARGGAFGDWLAAPATCLAYIVLTDQFPRNLFRGDARAFATDSLALGAARHALGLGHDRQLAPVQRTFIYLPFEHSENLADQTLAVELMTRLDEQSGRPDMAQWAQRHHDVIARFGRFPHRNAALGRSSSPEEIVFLSGPGSSF